MGNVNSKQDKYRRALLAFLTAEAKMPTVNETIVRKIVADEQRGEYLLLNSGWRGNQHLHSNIYHFELKSDGKIWIHANWTDRLIDEDFTHYGIDPGDIVIGFVPDYYRTMLAE
ncbi:MAG: element excision factor XisI family protein [Saprospiraceae bacterium]|nr:element excision factor XisI family protein [Saprospiraceae bacterium]